LNDLSIFRRNRDANHDIGNKTNGCLSLSNKYRHYNPHYNNIIDDNDGINTRFFNADDANGYNNAVELYTRVPDTYGD